MIIQSGYEQLYCQYANTHRDHLPFSGHVGRSVRQTQLCLQGVEVCFQFCFLFNTRRLVLAPVSTVLLKFLLHTSQRVVCLAAVEPWHCAPDPLQQLWTLTRKLFCSVVTLQQRTSKQYEQIRENIIIVHTSLANRSYSSIRRSFSWLTFKTLQILLAAVSAYKRNGTTLVINIKWTKNELSGYTRKDRDLNVPSLIS